jgi:hypothetical protein
LGSGVRALLERALRVAPRSRVVEAGTLRQVSAERDEVRELVERLPEEQVPAVLS